tara:strand:- start:3603 stop:4262 length:660 start_codon:yes stop_codon:yes gene_type:complete
MDLMPVVEDFNDDNEATEQINIDLKEDTEEENPNFIYEDDDEDDVMPVVEVKREEYKKEDIFQTTSTPHTKPPKKKRVLTEEHKAKLAIARVKAMETRRRNTAEKKEMKELEAKAKQKKKQELKDYVDAPKERKPIKDVPIVEKVIEKVIEERPKSPTITKKDLEDAQLEAIIKYEALRKERKRVKMEANKVEDEKRVVRETIKKALNRNDDGYWDNCF